jgi:hypothetical protein
LNYNIEIPDSIEDYDESNYWDDDGDDREIFSSDIFKKSLDNGMFDFIIEYAHLFGHDSLNKYVWIWLKKKEKNISNIQIPNTINTLLCHMKGMNYGGWIKTK